MSTVPDGAPPAGADAAPVCPRHPSREAYVRCQRCERPVCPECQRPAAVGVQCVDCVREGAKSVRTARTVLGGRADGGRPVVTQTIIGINVVAYVLQLAVGSRFTNLMDFYPPLAVAEPWRFLTSAFVHAPTPLHIAFNMYAVYLFGPYLEQLLGRVRYVALYLVSALGGSVGYFLLADPFSESWRTSVVGASGAVFGLLGAFFAVNRRLGRETGGVVALIGINFAIGFFVSGIAWQGHLGGLVTGGVTAALVAWAAQARKQSLQPVIYAGVVVLLVVLTLVKIASAGSGRFIA